MSLELILAASRSTSSVGEVSMPRMYSPRLTPEQSMCFNWQAFKDGLQPFSVVPLTKDVEVACVDKTSLWAPSDVCCFFGGNKDILTIEDLTSTEGIEFLRFHHSLVKGLQTLGNVHRDQYGQLNVAFGFNPEDFQLGAHSIRRLHSHVFTPHHWITDGRAGSPPLRKEVPWKHLPWFDRLKFFEPFSCVYFDFIQHWLDDRGSNGTHFLQPAIERGAGHVSLYLKNNEDFPDFFPTLQELYVRLHEAYSTIEALFTARAVDPDSQRFVPNPQSDRVINVEQYLTGTTWLSEKSKQMLRLTARNLQKATDREPGVISSASEAWITKGFAGALMFSFGSDDTIRLDFFPRVLSTSGVERAVYGLGRPTLIRREERSPTSYEQLENEKFLSAVKSVLGKT